MALFGCAPKRPLDYSGRAGLIWAMNGGRLVELPCCVAALENQRSTYEWKGAHVKEPMSGQSIAGILLCPRCKAAQMAEVTSIAPLLHEPDLIAYECPRCGHLTSIVQPP